MQRRAPLVLVTLLCGGLPAVGPSCAPAPASCASDDECEDGRRCVDETCAAGVAPTVRILELRATPSRVPVGGDVTVSWQTRNATSCELSPGAGVVPRVGSFTTTVLETTSFALTCEGPGGPAHDAVAVTVESRDAGVPDGGGAPDGGNDQDAGLDDGGLEDAGPPDGGPLDASPPDAAPSDAGAVDAGPVDAGPVDPGSDDGGVPPLYPRSCSDARVRSGATTDGVYTLDLDGQGPAPAFDTYCDMTTEGGGWALVLKVDGSKQTFRYSADLWTNDQLLNAEALQPEDGIEAKLLGYLLLPVDRVRVTFADADGRRGLSIPLAAPALRDLVVAGADSDEGPEAWGALADGEPLGEECLSEGISVGLGAGGLFAGGTVRIGAVGGTGALCTSPQDFVGVGFSNSIACLALPTAGYVDSCSMSGGRPAFATVWVRDEDFTDLSPQPSCEKHLELGRKVSGLYRVGLQGEQVEVYCDMTTDGGGWTLVGASARGASAPSFGWRSQAGNVRDDAAAYSLGALAHDLSFEQALVGRRGTAKKLRSNAYRVTLPDGFFTDEGETTAYPVNAPDVVLGTCAPGTYGMFRHWGHTALTTHFHIRDNQGATNLGLTPSGLSLWYESCEQGGLLDGTQGLLFVR